MYSWVPRTFFTFYGVRLRGVKVELYSAARNRQMQPRSRAALRLLTPRRSSAVHPPYTRLRPGCAQLLSGGSINKSSAAARSTCAAKVGTFKACAPDSPLGTPINTVCLRSEQVGSGVGSGKTSACYGFSSNALAALLYMYMSHSRHTGSSALGTRLSERVMSRPPPSPPLRPGCGCRILVPGCSSKQDEPARAWLA